MVDFVNASTFRKLAHFFVHPRAGSPWTNNILKQNAIIYTSLDFIEEIFANLRFTSNKYIFITHSSDFVVSKSTFERRPSCIKKWFAECSDYEHPDLIPIPIGLSDQQGFDKLGWDVEWFMQEENLSKLKSNPKNTRTVYCTWNYINNPPKRTGILKKLKDNGIDYLRDRHGQEEGPGEYKEWKDYLETASHYKFHISPAGNGLDSHRTWDALYMDCIPIVIKHSTFKCASGLPVLQINDWSDITHDLLDSFAAKTYNMDQLYMAYWSKYIMDEFNKL